eukprot:6197135-Pleurochrysis_carterae.AAC.1
MHAGGGIETISLPSLYISFVSHQRTNKVQHISVSFRLAAKSILDGHAKTASDSSHCATRVKRLGIRLAMQFIFCQPTAAPTSPQFNFHPACSHAEYSEALTLIGPLLLKAFLLDLRAACEVQTP